MTYMDLPKMVVLISNTVLGFFYVIIILKLANIQENYRKINSKYETSISSLKEYEDIILILSYISPVNHAALHCFRIYMPMRMLAA